MSIIDRQGLKSSYEWINSGGGRGVKAWNWGVPFDQNTIEQLRSLGKMPFIYKWVAAMPDAHLGQSGSGQGINW